MNSLTERIIDYSEGNLSVMDRVKFESELKINAELNDEYRLFLMVNEVMQAKIDLDEIYSDGNLPQAEVESDLLVTEFKKQPSRYADINIFVENSLLSIEDLEAKREIDQIMAEINVKNIDAITEVWVDEWNSSQSGSVGLKHKEVVSFVKQSLAENHNSSITERPSVSWYKSTMIRVISFSAAAAIVLIFVVRTMLLPVSPDKLFTSYYKPYQAVTSVTRSDGDGLNSIYNQAIVNYRNGDFQQAAVGFELVMKSDTFRIAPKFFAGLSHLELGNYTKAIELLNKIDAKNADFNAEAKWYLGLIYLKVGQKEKALSCFSTLSSTSGYYQQQASELVDVLKD